MRCRTDHPAGDFDPTRGAPWWPPFWRCYCLVYSHCRSRCWPTSNPGWDRTKRPPSRRWPSRRPASSMVATWCAMRRRQLNFNAFIATATTRRLGVPDAGISLAPGRYWVRVDNDCAAPAGFAGSPAFVPVVVQDDPGGGCSDTVDANETVVLTAWSEVTDGANRIIGRARLRAHYTIGNPWKHSCYDQDGGLCIEDAVGGCNNNPCIDPSDPNHPNGPAVGDLPIPSDIRCGTGGSGSYPAIPVDGHSDRCPGSARCTSDRPVRHLPVLSVGAEPGGSHPDLVSRRSRSADAGLRDGSL